MDDRERLKKLHLRIGLGFGIAILILIGGFIVIELKTPHNNFFTTEIERYFYSRYGEECEFSFSNTNDENITEVHVEKCNYSGKTASYIKDKKTDDLVSVLAPDIFSSYASDISAATHGATDHVSYASYVELDKVRWGHIPELDDVLSGVTSIQFDLNDLELDKEILRGLDSFVRNNFRLSVLSYDGVSEYYLVVRVKFKNESVYLSPYNSKVGSYDENGKKSQEYTYDEYFK